jgi:hypothetical protein
VCLAALLVTLAACVEEHPSYTGEQDTGSTSGTTSGTTATAGSESESTGTTESSGGVGTESGGTESTGTSTPTGSGTSSTTDTSGTIGTSSTTGTTGGAVEVTVPIDGDTHIRQGSANTNYGSEPALSVQQSGNRRTLLLFDQAEIESAVASGAVTQAEIRLYVTANNGQWGTGRAVSIHRLLQAWTEAGATWNCAIDTNLGNSSPDCPTDAWDMGNLEPIDPEIVATQIVFNDTLEQWLAFDVTDDVQAMLAGTIENLGWLVKKANEGQNGSIDLASREHPTADLRPVLVMTVE